MDHNAARSLAHRWVNEHYGTFLSVRSLAPVRRAQGRHWVAELVCAIKEGDVPVGTVVFDDHGEVAEPFDADAMVDALVRVRTAPPPSLDVLPDPEDELDFSDLGDDASATEDPFDRIVAEETPEEIRERANALIATGEKEHLLEARDLLPRLLEYQDMRGPALHQMGELELLLGEPELAMRHLDAAAREYADLANLDGLTMVTELASQILPPDEFNRSAIRSLFNQTRLKLRPLTSLKEAPLFVGLGPEELFAMEGIAAPMSCDPGDTLVREGDVADAAYLIQSGTLAVQIETPDGGVKIVRSCFPGDFLGETAVLEPPGATRTATVVAASAATLWRFDGETLRTLCDEYPSIRLRIESAKTLHQLDSFISTNEQTASLDVSMRDELLGCITSIARFPSGTVLSPKGALPEHVFLIANGHIACRDGERTLRTYGPDAFAGLRDTLHELPLEGDLVTTADSTLVVMDPDQLRAIARDATPEVVAILEKLE